MRENGNLDNKNTGYSTICLSLDNFFFAYDFEYIIVLYTNVDIYLQLVRIFVCQLSLQNIPELSEREDG